jgi:hypothetical protein
MIITTIVTRPNTDVPFFDMTPDFVEYSDACNALASSISRETSEDGLVFTKVSEYTEENLQSLYQLNKQYAQVRLVEDDRKSMLGITTKRSTS